MRSARATPLRRPAGEGQTDERQRAGLDAIIDKVV